MNDQRAEAVEAMARAMADGGYPLRQRAEAALDALTKPRTDQKCEECGGHGGAAMFHVNDLGIQESTWVDCSACSGSGTVTRGPIAVLVPPDAVEIMARAIDEAPNPLDALPHALADQDWNRYLCGIALDALYRRTGEG